MRFEKTEKILARRERNVARGVATAHPVVAARAQGAELWDVDGNRFLDFVVGIGVLNVGHNHPSVVKGIKVQLDLISHAAFQVAAYEPYIDLAEKLNQLVGGSEPYKSVFFTSGAEAVENAIKIARGYTNRPAVIAFRGGFHGRTLLGVSLTGISQPYKQNFGPFPADIFHTPFPDPYHGITSENAIAALEEVFATDIAPDRVAAVIVEPVQGDGGFRPAPVEFMRALREITAKHGIVLICDEIQTGFGRTGKMFGFQLSGIRPDLVTLAKSLAGGMPISGVVGKEKIMDAPTPGGLGGTYGGNALACGAALGVLEAFEKEDLLGCANEIGQQLRAGLASLQQKYACIGEVRGVGAMLAIEIVNDRASKQPAAAMARKIIDEARNGGLLVITCGVQRNVVRFLPPLIATPAQIEEALNILDGALNRALN